MSSTRGTHVSSSSNEVPTPSVCNGLIMCITPGFPGRTWSLHGPYKMGGIAQNNGWSWAHFHRVRRRLQVESPPNPLQSEPFLGILTLPPRPFSDASHTRLVTRISGLEGFGKMEPRFNPFGYGSKFNQQDTDRRSLFPFTRASLFGVTLLLTHTPFGEG